MNTEKSFSKAVRILLWMVVALFFAVIGTGGCAYNRATEDGALARFGINLELLPSSSSDDVIGGFSKEATEIAKNSNATNAHDSGIRKTIARTKVTTTTTVGPSREHIRN